MYNKTVVQNDMMNLEKTRDSITDKLIKLKNKVPQKMKLRGIKHGNTYQYFLRPIGTTKSGTYIKKKERDMARNMAMIEYYEYLLEEINDKLLEMEKIIKGLDENIYVSALNRMTDAKKDLVSIPFVSDEEYVLNWLHQEFEKLEFKENASEYYTRKGLRVRSKTEVIIADILDEMSIPFIYEKPLKLSSGTIHPDFTLLNIKTRKEVYWEHFGMMDDIEYRNNTFYKIRKYEEAGLYQPESLIWTFETSKFQINTKQLRKMIWRMKETMGWE